MASYGSYAERSAALTSSTPLHPSRRTLQLDEEDEDGDGTGGAGVGLFQRVADTGTEARDAPDDFFPEFPLPGSEAAVEEYTGEDLEIVRRIMHFDTHGRSNAFLKDAPQTFLEDLLSLCGYTDEAGNRVKPPPRMARSEEEERTQVAAMRSKEKEKRVQLTSPETITLCVEDACSPVQHLAQWYFQVLAGHAAQVDVSLPLLEKRPAVFLVNDPLCLGWFGISFQKELARLAAQVPAGPRRPNVNRHSPLFLLLSDLENNLPPGVDLATMTAADFKTCASFYIPVTVSICVMVVDDGTLPPSFAQCLYSAAHENAWHLALAIDLAIAAKPTQPGAPARSPYAFYEKIKEKAGTEKWMRSAPSRTFGVAPLCPDPFQLPDREEEAPHLTYRIVQDPEVEWEEDSLRFNRLLAQESAPPPRKTKEAAEDMEEVEEVEEEQEEQEEEGDADYQPASEAEEGTRRSKRAKGNKGKDKKKNKKRKGKKKAPATPEPSDRSPPTEREENEDALGGARMFPREPSPAPSVASARSRTGETGAASPTLPRETPVEESQTAAQEEEEEPVDPTPFEKYFFFDRTDPSTGGICPRIVAHELPLLSLVALSRPISFRNLQEGPGNLWGVRKIYWNYQSGATRIPRPTDAHSMIVQTPSEHPTTILFSDFVSLPRGAKKQPLFRAATGDRPTTVQQAKQGHKEEALDMVRQHHEQCLDPERPRGPKDPSLMEKPMQQLSSLFQSGRFFTPSQLPALFALALRADAGYEAHPLPARLREGDLQRAEVYAPEDPEKHLAFWQDLVKISPYAPRNFRLVLPRGDEELTRQLRQLREKRREDNRKLLGDVGTVFDPHEEARNETPARQGEDTEFNMDSLGDHLQDDGDDEDMIGQLQQRMEEEMDL